MSVFYRWQEGELTAQEALRLLLDDYEECEQRTRVHESLRNTLRGQIEQVMQRVGSKATVGNHEIVMVEASYTKTYDKKALDKLVVELAARGYGDIAGEIANCAKETVRSGSLRIQRSK